MDELLTLLKQIGLPYAYDHFAPGKAPAPPFLCYLKPETHNFAADGIVYLSVEVVHVELYTDYKNPAIEKRVETVLTDAGIFFDKTEVYIESEHLFEVLYSFDWKGEE